MKEPRKLKEARRKERRRLKKERRGERRERERAGRCPFAHTAAAPAEAPKTTDHLKGCPMYKGLIVPAVADMDADGRPVFARLGKMNDRCLKEALCSVCAKPLDEGVWYIGNPAEDGNLYGIEPGLHFDCIFYALAHCPDQRKTLAGTGTDITQAGMRVWWADAYDLVTLPRGLRSTNTAEVGKRCVRLINAIPWAYHDNCSDGAPGVVLLKDLTQALTHGGDVRGLRPGKNGEMVPFILRLQVAA